MYLKDLQKNKKTLFSVALLLFVGFLLRVFFVTSWLNISGDLLAYADWGEKFWQLGVSNFYYHKEWYYSPPNYPPIFSLVHASSFWLFEHKYVLAQLHNLIKIPPAAFIIYFYDFGYYLLLKLPSIFADLGLSLLICGLVYKFTKSKNKALVAAGFYLFNPVTIFLSGVWGQTDSVIAFLGLLSFILLANKRTALSIPFYFTSLYFKPNWAIFLPFYLFLLIKLRPRFRELFYGALITVTIFVVTTQPFTKGNVFSFIFWLLKTRILPNVQAADKASVSAFNFYTVLFAIDKSPADSLILEIPAKILGYVSYSAINLATFVHISKKNRLFAIITGLFTIGLGSHLFLTNMLERYFFPALVPMIILMFTNTKTLIWSVAINIVTFSNLVWAFFRRTSDEIGQPFTNNNFFLIRSLSVMIVSSWLAVAINLGVFRTALIKLKKLNSRVTI